METLTQEPDPGGKPGGARIGELASRLGVRPSALRVWEAAGLLTASRDPHTGTRCYSAEEVYHASVINLLRKAGRGHDQIRPLIDELRVTGSTAALSVALRQRRHEHDRCSRLLLEGAVALHRLLEASGVLSAGQSL
ncbi:DNA-binding transcriptional regulator, MerR family [Lentzea jiangxiensis]|uniref:DNA-binding transcriptional regulator, MerR family n=2 Tax=Lentzea jiangxiensis TaxID=641025 RepID=A0A1H0WUM0_9PSEU|nr:DNA-binding transcriptional regulator, MerR family [Lentzea jiangxiensis]